jgi:hypothetical protein
MMLLLTALLASVPAHAKKDRATTAVRIDLEGSPGLCPGDVQKLDLYGTDDTGRERKIQLGQWKELQLAWDIGAVSPKGVLEMPLDPTSAWGKAGTLTVQSLSDPQVTASATLPARYDCDLALTRTGSSGPIGPRGDRGSSAAESSGGHGQSGGRGQVGGNGPSLDVRVHLTQDPHSGADVLQVAVEDLVSGESWNTAVGADGGHMAIRTLGGPGGGGGAGGDGGSGATPYHGGDGGQGGAGGNGGRGGLITVRVDPSAEGALGVLDFTNAGGSAGTAGPGGAGGPAFDPGEPGQTGPEGHAGSPGQPGPTPDIRVEPVGLLW